MKEHGGLIGVCYAARRILRCNPWGGCGHDPVPPKKTNNTRL
ncbi:MAG: membrane protein insertion efficiency factor YidD [Paracoccaceae bacterium]